MGSLEVANFLLMAGKGDRFKPLYNLPKPLIRVHGSPMFLLAAKCLNNALPSKVKTTLCLNQLIRAKISPSLTEFHYVDVGHTENPIETALKALRQSELKNGPVAFGDSDQLFKLNRSIECVPLFESLKIDAFIFYTTTENKNFGKIEIDENDKVISAHHRMPKGRRGIVGVYCFKNRDTFLEYGEQTLGFVEGREPVMSDVVNRLVLEKKSVKAFKVKSHIPLGTPQELERYISR